MKKILLAVLILSMVLLSACGPKCPECPGSSAWSACNEEAVKTRTAYRCSEETNFECQEFDETQQCATEVRVKGRTGLSEMLITPTIEKNVKGIITVELTKAPDETQAVIFVLNKGKIDMEAGLGPGIPIDQDSSDGWSTMYDTTEYENGLYEVAAIVGEGFADNQPPLDAVIAQIIIDN